MGDRLKIFFCLLILSMIGNTASASFNFPSVIRKMATDILGEELVENIIGIDSKEMMEMPSLPKLLENPKSLDFANINDQPKTPITDKDKKNLDNHFLYELFTEIRSSDPSEDEYQQWMNILTQGATREGVFRALIYDKIYERLEFSSSRRVSADAKEFTVLFYQKFIGIKISQTKMDQMNVYALKRIVCEKTLQMVDTLYQKNKLVGVMLSIVEDAKRGRYLTVPGGPIIDWDDKGMIKAFVNEIKRIAKNEKCVFVRVRPQLEANEFSKKIFSDYGFRNAPIHLHAELTSQLDITKSEEKILAGMRKTTRYEIKKAISQGVKITNSADQRDIDKFYELQLKTAKRQGFYAHTQKYHRLMWKHLKEKIAHLLVAEYKNEIISAWVLFTHDGFLYYPYGASTDKHKEVMANNLMMWEAIKFGKKLGLSTFDLWGREVGKGFTKFKEGYNPKVIEFVGSWDLVINKPLYYIYRIAEKVRWFLLRLTK